MRAPPTTALGQVTAAHPAALEQLVAALDARDQETQSHSRRVSRYARGLARELGVRGPDLLVVERGALLHDIGKIAVPDEVLRHPGPLSAAQWEQMKRHCVLGWALVRDALGLEREAGLVLEHHERWDGDGYPRCLSREEISLGARIFAVVDAFDAITSGRPYRAALPVEEARHELVRCSGRQFDPRVVEAFVRIAPAAWAEIGAPAAAQGARAAA